MPAPILGGRASHNSAFCSCRAIALGALLATSPSAAIGCAGHGVHDGGAQEDAAAVDLLEPPHPSASLVFAAPNGADACEVLGVQAPGPRHAAPISEQPGFVDVTTQLGLEGIHCPFAAVADVNSDGAEDLFLPCGGNGKPEVYLQCGGGKFVPLGLVGRTSEALEIAASATVAGIADTNDDGLRDLLVAYGDRIVAYRNDGGLRFSPQELWHDPVRSRIAGLTPLPGPSGMSSHVYVSRLATGARGPQELRPEATNLIAEIGRDQWNFTTHLGDGRLASSSATYGAAFYRTPLGGLLIVINDGGGPIQPFRWSGVELRADVEFPREFRIATGMGVASVPLLATRPIREERRVMFAETGKLSSWAITAAGITNASADLLLDHPETQVFWGGACGYVDGDSYPDCFFGSGVGGSSPARRQSFAANQGPAIETAVRPRFLRGARAGERIVFQEVAAAAPFELGEVDTFATALIRLDGTDCDLLVLPSHPDQLTGPLRVFQSPCAHEGGRRLTFDVAELLDWAIDVELDNGEVVSVESDPTFGIGHLHRRSFATVALGDAQPIRAVVHAGPDLLIEINDGLVPGTDIVVRP